MKTPETMLNELLDAVGKFIEFPMIGNTANMNGVYNDIRQQLAQQDNSRHASRKSPLLPVITCPWAGPLTVTETPRNPDGSVSDFHQINLLTVDEVHIAEFFLGTGAETTMPEIALFNAHFVSKAIAQHDPYLNLTRRLLAFIALGPTSDDLEDLTKTGNELIAVSLSTRI
jgi:hypothetical protein